MPPKRVGLVLLGKNRLNSLPTDGMLSNAQISPKLFLYFLKYVYKASERTARDSH